MKSYRCVICGYTHMGDEPPESCPVCGAPSSDFEVFEDKAAETKQTKQKPASWKCLVCGYVHEGDNPPESCPICGVESDMFEPYHNEQADKTNNETVKIVIIGGGIAGLSCAEEVRNKSEKAAITLISAESLLPYYRINLTRYLAGEITKESLTIYPASFYEDKRIELVSGTEVSEINKDSKQVQLNNGTKISFDKLIIANGAHPFVPPIPGKELGNVITIRDLKDTDFLLEKMQQIDVCICIGGGILGLETAGAIVKSGVSVTLLEGLEWLMPRQLNKKGAVILKEYLKNIGIGVRENVKIQEIIGDGVCEGVKLSSGEVLPTKLVIITAGVRPNTHLAKKTGLEVNKGLVVNNHMQTSNEDIYAAGDVTEHDGEVYGLWNVAQFQGKIAAQNAAGMDTQFGGIPRSTVLKVLGLDIFSIGEFIPIDESCFQYEKETPEAYITFVLRSGKIIGSIVIGDKALSSKVKQTVEKGLDFPLELFDSAQSIIDKIMRL